MRRWPANSIWVLVVVAAALLTGSCGQPAGTVTTRQPPPPAGVPASAAPSPAPAAAPAVAGRIPAEQPHAVTLTVPAGRTIRVRTSTPLSTRTSKPGDSFAGVLSETLAVAGGVVAPKGAAVSGVVTRSDSGGRVKGVASLAVRITRLELADGRSVDVSTAVLVRQAPATKKKDALKIGVGSGVGAAIGALAGGGKGAAVGAGSGAGAGTGAVLLTRGDPAVLPVESLLTFTLRRPVSFTR